MNASDFSRKRAAIQRRARGRESFARKALGHLAREAGAVPIAAGGKLMGYKLPDGSVSCTKQRYREEVAAMMELARIARHSPGAYIPVRSYRCELCCGWHLTSRAVSNAAR